MTSLILLILAGCATLPQDIVHINPEYHGPDEVVLQSVTATRMVYAFRSERGIFSFDMRPLPERVERVTFIFKDQRMLESLSITPAGLRQIFLYEPKVSGPEGVEVLRIDKDWQASFSGPALGFLRQGGRFQVIDAYR